MFRLGGAKYRQSLKAEPRQFGQEQRIDTVPGRDQHRHKLPVEPCLQLAMAIAEARQERHFAAGALQAPVSCLNSMHGFHATSHARQHSCLLRPPIARQARPRHSSGTTASVSGTFCSWPSVNKRSSAGVGLTASSSRSQKRTLRLALIQRASSARKGCHT